MKLVHEYGLKDENTVYMDRRSMWISGDKISKIEDFKYSGFYYKRIAISTNI